MLKTGVGYRLLANGTRKKLEKSVVDLRQVACSPSASTGDVDCGWNGMEAFRVRPGKLVPLLAACLQLTARGCSTGELLMSDIISGLFFFSLLPHFPHVETCSCPSLSAQGRSTGILGWSYYLQRKTFSGCSSKVRNSFWRAPA